MERERCLEVVQVKIKNNSYVGKDFLKKNIVHNEMSRKKVSFHSPFQLLFLLPKNESTKTSINTINFHGKKSHIENTVGINTCMLFTHLRLFFHCF